MGLKDLKDFTIHFEGLKSGSHHFTYQITDTFFTFFEYAEIHKGNLQVLLTLQKQSSMLILEFTLSGKVVVPCDRCLEDLSVDISGNPRLIVKFGHDTYEETEEILILKQGEADINIAQFLFENISLLLPQRNVHDEGLCKPEAIEKLKQYSVSEKKDTAEQWAALQKLKNN